MDYVKIFSKPGYTYGISTEDASEEKLRELGFIEMQSEQPGDQYIANADGTWRVNVDKAFDMLRAERNKRIAETDYLVTSDYPISGEKRESVLAYRMALRDLPSQPGAPWDGSAGIPWPEKPF